MSLCSTLPAPVYVVNAWVRNKVGFHSSSNIVSLGSTLPWPALASVLGFQSWVPFIPSTASEFGFHFASTCSVLGYLLCAWLANYTIIQTLVRVTNHHIHQHCHCLLLFDSVSLHHPPSILPLNQ